MASILQRLRAQLSSGKCAPTSEADAVKHSQLSLATAGTNASRTVLTLPLLQLAQQSAKPRAAQGCLHSLQLSGASAADSSRSVPSCADA